MARIKTTRLDNVIVQKCSLCGMEFVECWRWQRDPIIANNNKMYKLNKRNKPKQDWECWNCGKSAGGFFMADETMTKNSKEWIALEY